MEHAGDVRVAQPRRRARLAQEPLPGGVAVEVRGVDDFQRDVAAQARVERLVRDAHRTAAQFPQGAVGALENLIMLEGFRVGHARHGRASEEYPRRAAGAQTGKYHVARWAGMIVKS